MLAGKEIEKQIGEFGHVSLDVMPDAKVAIELGLKIDLIDIVKKLAAKTETQIDDKVVEFLEKLVKKAQ